MKSARWNAYVLVGNIKVYLRKHMTTTEAVKWLDSKCTNHNGVNLMCGLQVHCERK